MNNLFYELIYDKKSKRMMKTLSEIDKRHGSITYTDLMSELGVTRKTLNTDVDFIMETLPDDFSLTIDGTTINIINNNSKQIQDYILEFAMDSAIFRIMENVLYDIPMNIHGLAEELFISESSIRKRIIYYNKIIKRFNVELSSYSIQLLGDEICLRYFLHAFFTEFRQLVILAPRTKRIIHTDLYSKLRNAMLEKNYPIVNTSYFKAEHWFSLAVVRIQDNNFVKIDDDKLKHIILASIRYKEFKEVYLNVTSEICNTNDLPEDEIMWAFITILDTVIYSSNEKRFGMYRSDLIYNEKSTMLHTINESMAHKVGLSGNGDFSTVLFAYFRNLTLLTALSPVYQVSSTSIKEIAKKISHIYTIYG
ncbi:MAG: helix-turn-helix domain-containing protein [Suipraeoptans sp.]